VFIDWTKADWANLSAEFDNIHYFNLFENCVDSVTKLNTFYTVTYNGLNEFVPVRIIDSMEHSKISKCRLLLAECRVTKYQLYLEHKHEIINSGNLGKLFNKKYKLSSVNELWILLNLKLTGNWRFFIYWSNSQNWTILLSVFSSAYMHDTDTYDRLHANKFHNVHTVYPSRACYQSYEW